MNLVSLDESKIVKLLEEAGAKSLGMYVTGFAGRVSYFDPSSGIVTLTTLLAHWGEPHTSGKNGTSVIFTKMYVDISVGQYYDIIVKP